MKKVFTVLLLSSFVLLQSCKDNSTTDQKRHFKTMIIKSEGEVSAQPDEASITLQLECADRDIKVAKSCIIKISNDLNLQIEGFKIDKEDVLTTSINLSKEYKWQNSSSVFVGYKASITTHLLIRKLSVLENLYTELLQNENINIRGLSFSHSKIDSLSNVAYQKALENANITADQLLLKMAETEKEVLRVANIELPSMQAEYYEDYENIDMGNVAGMSKSKRESITLNAGSMYARKTLTVQYKIK